MSFGLLAPSFRRPSALRRLQLKTECLILIAYRLQLSLPSSALCVQLLFPAGCQERPAALHTEMYYKKEFVSQLDRLLRQPGFLDEGGRAPG